MATVAGDSIAAVLAAAKIDCFRFLCLEFLWGEIASLVGTVAERLGRAFAAGAKPVTLAFFDFNGVGAFLGNDRRGLRHDFSLNEAGLDKSLR